MKNTTRELLNKVKEAHDWNEGQTHGGSGTKMDRTDICRVCSLRRHWSSDTQNGNNGEYRFSDGETNEDLSLRQALQRGCA